LVLKGQLVRKVQLVLVEKLVGQETQVLGAHPDQRVHLGTQEHLDLLDKRDLLVSRDNLVLREIEVNKEPQDLQEHKGLLGNQAPWETVDLQGLPDPMELQDQLDNWVQLVGLDPWVSLDYQDHLDFLDKVGLLGQLDLLDLWVIGELWEQLVLQDSQVPPVSLAQQDLGVNKDLQVLLEHQVP